MRRFADLYDAIDRTTSTNAKVAALVAYLSSAPAADAAWALFFLTGRRLKRLLPSRLLHQWTQEVTAIPEWLIEASYAEAGDFAEAIALLVAPAKGRPVPQRRRHAVTQTSLFEEPSPDVDHGDVNLSLSRWLESRILPLRDVDDEERRVRVMTWWSHLDRRELFLLNKLLTGEFRVGVSHTLVVRAVAQVASLPAAVVEHRLMGTWEPSEDAFRSLVGPEGPADDPSRPFPFCLASPLEDPVETLGDPGDWLVEWKWDGIRAQLIHRRGRVFVWSRGEELITERFPEIAAAGLRLPEGTVLDGEIVAFGDGAPRPFADLQQRIGRQRRVREVAAGIPVVFLAYDVLEHGGQDLRGLTMRERRERLLSLVGGGEVLRISAHVAASTWDGLAELRRDSRARGVEGLMLKRWSSVYRPGRKRGDWWKWKIEPFTMDAVLVYAQPGSGRRATVFTDYTFAVWSDGELVPVAKAYSGLSDEEIDELDRWIRRHTTERFGPVSAVDPVHVFELGFEAIARSTRHKSGIAVRFPRILRWRKDKPASEADTLDALEGMIERRPRP
jgi:DNA ligase-1